MDTLLEQTIPGERLAPVHDLNLHKTFADLIQVARMALLLAYDEFAFTTRNGRHRDPRLRHVTGPFVLQLVHKGQFFADSIYGAMGKASHMTKVRILDHVALMVTDLERSYRFYHDLLGLNVVAKVAHGGWPVETMTQLPGGSIVEYRMQAPETPEVTIDLIEWVAPKSPVKRLKVHHVPSAHVCFGVDNLQETYDRLVTLGVDFVTPPVTWPPEEGGWRVVFVHDPDGNLLEFTEVGVGVNIPADEGITG